MDNEQLKRIADALEEVLRLVKKDQEEAKKDGRKKMNKKEKQYQAALDATFTNEGYLKSNLNPKDIAARVYTAAEIAIGDGGFRAKEIVENFQQLMEMDSARYAKQQKFYG